MAKFLYIGLVITKRTGEIFPVSASHSPEIAGELMNKYLDVYDPDRADLMVWKVSGGISDKYTAL